MPVTRQLLVPVLAVIAAVFCAHALATRGAVHAEEQAFSVDGARYRVDDGEARRVGARRLTPEDRRRTLRFATDVSAGDRRLVTAAIAAARPEARQLIDLVDGLVVLRVARPADGALGTTQAVDERYDVVLDLATAMRRFGERGVARLVLHEIAHVIDFALVTDRRAAVLDAGTPPGYGCEAGVMGGCTSVPERFAESFAKWATSDIGVDLDVGYKVPPPSSLDDWGRPLAQLDG